MASMWRGLDARNAARWSAWALGALLGLAGCADSHPVLATCTTSADCAVALSCLGGVCQMQAGITPLDRCDTEADCASVAPNATDAVDLLLVVDNSGSMTEEQQSVLTEIPRLIQVLASGDRDGDGAADFRPVRSLHIGVISTDMGTGSVSGIESCDAGFGDDGVMTNRGHTGPGCMPTYPSAIFTFGAGSDQTVFATAVGCVAALGNGGCGFEQQLEATLKAVSLAPRGDGGSPVSWTSPGYQPPVFYGSTFGHGGAGGANDGFLRSDSVLAIILVSDEEDCSTSNPSIFDRTDPRFSEVDLNLRCFMYADHQYPVQRYIEGLIGLRYSASSLVFTAIVGVPREAIDDALSYDAILALEAMQERIDPVLRNRLLPSCTAPAGRGVAYPPRRIVEVAQGLDRLGASTTVQSICDTSFTDAFDAILERIADPLLLDACLPRSLAVDAEGNIDCEVYELLPPTDDFGRALRCADRSSPEAYELAGVELATTGGVEERRELCRVRQVGRSGAGVTPGWFYDDGTLGSASMLPPGCSQHVSLASVPPLPGSQVTLLCAR